MDKNLSPQDLTLINSQAAALFLGNKAPLIQSIVTGLVTHKAHSVVLN